MTDIDHNLRIDGIQTHGVQPVHLEISAGECVCLSGPSGAGKTLLLRAIADLDPHDGEVWLDGIACRDTRPTEWRRRVALLCAESQWWEDAVGPHFQNVDAETLQRLGFETNVVQWTVSRLSSGERQRLALLRMLANEPTVLLLDEPTANLDAASIARVEELIADYRRRHHARVLWVSHDPRQIERVAHRHYRIEDGVLSVQELHAWA